MQEDCRNCPHNVVIARLIRFFNAPTVRDFSLERKVSFLKDKGLKQDGKFLERKAFLHCYLIHFRTLLIQAWNISEIFQI